MKCREIVEVLCMRLVCAADLGVKFGVQEVVVSVKFTEGMLGKEGLRCWSFAGDTTTLLVKTDSEGKSRHIHSPAVHHEAQSARADGLSNIIRNWWSLI